MNPNLAKLLTLQEIDSQIQELDNSSEHFPVQVRELEGEVSRAREHVEELEGRVAEIAREKESVTSAVEEARQALERSQSRLNSITTNREYDAVHTEIEANESAMANGKARIEKLDEERTALEESVEESRGSAKELEEKNGPQIAELKEKIAAIDGRRQELLRRREAEVQSIAPQFVRAYDHIKNRRASGQVISRVTDESRTCSLCHKVLEPQVVNELRAGRRLTMCQSCGSILIWQEDEAEESEAESG